MTDYDDYTPPWREDSITLGSGDQAPSLNTHMPQLRPRREQRRAAPATPDRSGCAPWPDWCPRCKAKHFDLRRSRPAGHSLIR